MHQLAAVGLQHIASALRLGVQGTRCVFVGPSYYDPETLTFYFHVAYYVSAGVFGAGEETFTLTPAQARALAAKAGKPSVRSNLKLLPQAAKRTLGNRYGSPVAVDIIR